MQCPQCDMEVASLCESCGNCLDCCQCEKDTDDGLDFNANVDVE